jgi:Skp family chaperone for outer membrane proteins
MKSKCMLALVLLAAAWAAAPAWCAAPPVIGTADHDKILSEFKQYQDAEKQYEAFRTQRQDQLDEAANTRLLDDKEKQQVLDLKAVAARTQAQNEQLAQLLGPITEARLKELRDLTAIPQRDATQEARLKELSALLDKRNKEVADLKATLDEQINKQADDLMKPINDKIDAALAKVAEKEHLTAILDKGSVLYGGKDVTANVLAELNKTP